MRVEDKKKRIEDLETQIRRKLRKLRAAVSDNGLPSEERSRAASALDRLESVLRQEAESCRKKK